MVVEHSDNAMNHQHSKSKGSSPTAVRRRSSLRRKRSSEALMSVISPRRDDEYSNKSHYLRSSDGKQKHSSERSSKLRSFRLRLYSTIVLIAGFSAIIWAGHVPLMFMILGIQTMMVKELFALARVAQEERKLPGFRAQQWYFYGVAALYMYVRFIKNNLAVEITSSARLVRALGWVLRRHTIISFFLYTAGFVSFVLTLKKGTLSYQFGQFAWTHMILLVVFLPSSCFVSNIFEGIIWFLLPCALVIVNDIGAYIAGTLFGRTPLIKLSPKKTWEGFIGGLVLTLVASWYLAATMQQSVWLTCPRTDLSIWQPMECVVPPPTFQVREWTLVDVPKQLDLPEDVASFASAALSKISQVWTHVRVRASPMQFHALALAAFASCLAPFGGFFASGFKRGFKIKDFGDSIPGHGGMTDRMDCQVVMATFSYIYYLNFVDRGSTSMGQVLSAAMKLAPLQQLDLMEHLANALAGRSMVHTKMAEAVATYVEASREYVTG